MFDVVSVIEIPMISSTTPWGLRSTGPNSQPKGAKDSTTHARFRAEYAGAEFMESSVVESLTVWAPRGAPRWATRWATRRCLPLAGFAALGHGRLVVDERA